MASSSTSEVLKGAGFFVKDCPTEFTEFDLFDAFSCYGLLDNIRFTTSVNAVGSTHKFWFVTMLTLDAADKIRAALKNGYLHLNQGIKLLIEDFLTADELKEKRSERFNSDKSPHDKSRTRGKNWVVQTRKIHTEVLPLHKPVLVKLVESLSIDETTDQPTFTVLPYGDAQSDFEYAQLADQLLEYTMRAPRLTSVPVNGDCVFRKDNRAFRARRVSDNQVYLLDLGEVVEYETTNIFAMHNQYNYLPAKVAVCGFDGICWLDVGISSFKKILKVLIDWSQQAGGLTAQTLGYKKGVNMVNLFCENAGVAEKLNKPGVCEYIPRNARQVHKYDREALLGIKNKVSSMPNISDDVDVQADLVHVLAEMKVSS